MNKRERDKALRQRIALICNAVDKAEPSRLLARWKKEGPDAEALEAMRRAIYKVDGTLPITTDALAAAFAAALRSFTKKRAAQHSRSSGDVER